MFWKQFGQMEVTFSIAVRMRWNWKRSEFSKSHFHLYMKICFIIWTFPDVVDVENIRWRYPKVSPEFAEYITHVFGMIFDFFRSNLDKGKVRLVLRYEIEKTLIFKIPLPLVHEKYFSFKSQIISSFSVLL